MNADFLPRLKAIEEAIRTLRLDLEQSNKPPEQDIMSPGPAIKPSLHFLAKEAVRVVSIDYPNWSGTPIEKLQTMLLRGKAKVVRCLKQFRSDSKVWNNELNMALETEYGKPNEDDKARCMEHTNPPIKGF